VEDAVAATRAAMEEGIVPGGGIALLNANFEVIGKDAGNISTVGRAVNDILSKALLAPIEAILINSGESPSKFIDELKNKKANDKSATSVWLGFNATLNKISDLKEAGIIDPLKVTKTAFLNAISVASNYLTIGAAITEIPEKKDPPQMPGGGGMEY
jgi:chaperonin GroEL